MLFILLNLIWVEERGEKSVKINYIWLQSFSYTKEWMKVRTVECAKEAEINLLWTACCRLVNIIQVCEEKEGFYLLLGVFCSFHVRITREFFFRVFVRLLLKYKSIFNNRPASVFNSNEAKTIANTKEISTQVKWERQFSYLLLSLILSAIIMNVNCTRANVFSVSAFTLCLRFFLVFMHPSNHSLS